MTMEDWVKRLDIFLQADDREVLKDAGTKPLMLLLLTVPYSLIYFIEIMDERNPIAYFFAVLIGFIFASNPKFQKAVNRDKWAYLALSAGILLLWYFWIVKPMDMSYGIIRDLKAYVIKAARLIPTFALLGLGNSLINKGGKVLKYLSKASFPIYIIHMPIVTYVGYLVLKLSLPPVCQYFLIALLAYLICFLLYEAYRRLTVGKEQVKTTVNRDLAS